MELKKPWFTKGYNSHGCWSTFEDIVETEAERDNEPFVGYTEEEIERYGHLPAIWITLSPWEAFMYVIGAGEIEEPKASLLDRYPNWMESVQEIDCSNIWVLPDTDDGDGGYLILLKE